jgi:hypothetical protein
MNRTKHMKHKKNTRRRHKLRKPRNTHKRYKKYNRCRTRSQRGGKTKEEVYGEVLSERLDAYKKVIPSEFHTYETFLNFISVYGESDLQHVVCGNFSDGDIRLHETTQLTRMKLILDRNTNPTPNIVKLKDLFLNPKFIINWTDFVISLKTTVDTRYSADLNLKNRMEALNADPLKPQPPPPQLHPGLAIPLPKRVLPRPASIIPGSEVDKRPYPPPGFTLQGNVWMGPNTVVPEDFYKKPPALPAAPAPASPAPPTPLTGQALINALFALKND